MGLSTDLPTIAIGLSTDSVQTIGASTMLPIMTVVSPGQDDMGGKPMVTTVAGVYGGITGVLIVAILCVCIKNAHRYMYIMMEKRNLIADTKKIQVAQCCR